MNLYSYDGPVMKFDSIISRRWYGETYAKSARKAKSNLTYQYKKQYGYKANVKITLPGEVKMIEESMAG